MTYRELRQMLTHIGNQQMTVRELRALLFQVEEQDEEMTDVDMIVLTHKAKEEK